MSKRRSHIKRAKVMRGLIGASDFKAWSLSYEGDWWIVSAATRRRARVAQAMRGYYQD